MDVQHISCADSLAHVVNSTVGLSHYVGSWILDSGVCDHVVGNPSHISNLSPPQIPHNITLAKGAKAQVSGIGKASHLSSQSFNYVLLISSSPYNLI